MSNFYKIILTILVFTLTYAIYEQLNKSSKKPKRLTCQNKTITFEKINQIKNLAKAQKLLQSNNYTLFSKIEYSKYMKSNLINLLNIKQANKKINDVIAKHITLNKKEDEKIIIDYYIYENDKKDKGKKGAKSKKYAGYLVFEFKYKNQLLYKIQSDYMSIKAEDIEERMNCIIKSFLSIKS